MVTINNNGTYSNSSHFSWNPASGQVPTPLGYGSPESAPELESQSVGLLPGPAPAHPVREVLHDQSRHGAELLLLRLPRPGTATSLNFHAAALGAAILDESHGPAGSSPPPPEVGVT